jgi:ArsR family transcriptional regulator
MTNLNLKKMLSSADKACALMKVLANRDRMMILCEISQHERCVSELEEKLEIYQPTLSQQLTVLRKEKLVKTRREGKQIYYSLESSQALAVIEVLYQQFCKH